MLSVVETIAVAGAKRFLERLAELQVERRHGSSRGSKRNGLSALLGEDRMSEALRTHLLVAERWASDIQFFLMPRPEATNKSTIELDITSVPRRLRTIPSGADHKSGSDLLVEEDLLTDNHHYLLLGDPGAGKTTTVKRLVGRLLSEPASPKDRWSVPIVAELRNHREASSVTEVIIDELGIRAEAEQLVPSARRHAKVERLQAYRRMQDEPETAQGVPLSRQSAISAGMNHALDVGPLPVRRFHDVTDADEYELVASILDGCGAVLLLDGLDEVRYEAREPFESSVVKLSRLVTSAKIVLTCRSGDYTRLFDGFHATEICALSPEQIDQIAERWLDDDATDFTRRLEGGAAAQLANRPLFLSQMIVLYQRTGDIPEQPFVLCNHMVRLMLHDWDYQRGVVRSTRYKNFVVDEKLKYLCHLAFHLSFELRSARFTHDELTSAYQSLCGRYGLPKSEADQVALELESHTGIIVETGYRVYEFSHLSIQEYLAAEHLVRLPDLSQLGQLYVRSPATMAVAVALSSDPDRLLMSLAAPIALSGYQQSFAAFVTRLVEEAPRFVGDEQLGAAAVSLILNCEHEDLRPITELLRYPGILPVTQKLIREAYDIRPYTDHDGVRRARFTQVRGVAQTDDLRLPSDGTVIYEVAEQLLDG